MVGRLIRRQAWLVGIALVLAGLAPRVALAQGNGKAQGVVKDAKGAPVDGATVVLQPAQGRQVQIKTNNKGEYSSNVPAGDYTVGAVKGDLASVQTAQRITAGATLTADFVVVDKKVAEAEAAKTGAFKAAFDAGAAALSGGRNDEAIAKFTEAAAANPTCSDCFANIGNSYVQKKDYDNAEKAYLKSIEIKPNAGSYTGLASVYTAQKKLDQASAAMSKATELNAGAPGGGGGANADALFNQGVTLWNAGKIDDAKKQFQAAVAADPNHAEAHYQLGMALVNEGNLAGAKTEWEMYLKLSPQGSHAAEVSAMLPQLK